MKPLTPLEQTYWDKYLLSLPSGKRPKNPFVEANYCGNREITDELIALYLAGKKWAGSGLVDDYTTMGDPLPKVGNFWIVLDSQDQPKMILETLRVERNFFKNISKEIAVAEGEGDLSVEYWQQAHLEVWKPSLPKWGIKDIRNAEVITEFFKIVFPVLA